MPRQPTGKPHGRPRFKPTDDDRKTVSLMCAVGIPHEGIARCIGDGIDDKTLRKHFKEELETAKVRANAKVGGTIFNAAIGGDMKAATLWAKTQMGWKETAVVENTHKFVMELPPVEDDVQEWLKKYAPKPALPQ